MSMQETDADVLVVKDILVAKPSDSIGWKIFFSIAAVAAALFIFFFLILPRLGSDPAQVTTAQIVERADSVPAPKTVDPADANVSQENDAYCKKDGWSQDAFVFNTWYCERFRPYAKTIDDHMAQADQYMARGETSSSNVLLWIVVIVLSVSQGLSWLMLAKKKDKDS